MKYYLLELISHEDKLFFSRITDSDTGKHSKDSYVLHAVRQEASDWANNIEHWLARSTTIEQRVMATYDAEDIYEARRLVKKFRAAHKMHLESLGYKRASDVEYHADISPFVNKMRDKIVFNLDEQE